MTNDKKFVLNGIQVWPTMLFRRLWNLYEEDSPAILEFLTDLQQTQAHQIESGIAVGSKSSHGLYESHFDLFAEKNPSLQRLVKFIEATLALAVSIANQHEAQPAELSVEFVDSWYHITNEGGFHDAHVHHGCSWCGIFYLQAGTSGRREGHAAPNGGSRFYCPFNLGGGYRDFGNKYLTSSMDAPIEDGLLLLFPSYLLHSGLPYVGSTDRVVIAFNARVYLKDSTSSQQALRAHQGGKTH